MAMALKQLSGRTHCIRIKASTEEVEDSTVLVATSHRLRR